MQGIAGFIYARTDSKRFPNKIFKRFGQRYLIDIVVQRLRCTDIDSIYLLTSERELDDPLAIHCESQGIKVFRGCFEDVVLRTVQAINAFSVEKFLRVNGDSPFISPALINYSLRYSNDKKFVSNLFNRTFPYGVAIELMDCDWYCENANSRLEANKEHLTHHLYTNVSSGDAYSITQNYELQNHRLTIDTMEDYFGLKSILSENYLIEYWDFLKCPRPKFNISE